MKIKYLMMLGLLPFNLLAQVDYSYLQNEAPPYLTSKTTSYFKLTDEIKNNKSCRELTQYVQNSMNTSSFIVLKNSKAIVELYANGANVKTKTKVWSVSKFLSGLMLGAQVKEHGMEIMERSLESFGLVRTEKSSDTFKDWSQVKLRNVWNMSSGLNWCEYSNCRAKDAAHIMYGSANQDATDYVLKQDLSHTPGSYYRYSAGNYVLLQAALKDFIGNEKEYLDLPYTSILRQLDIPKVDYAFEVDKKNVIMGGSGLSITARGVAKLGQLLLNKGRWKSREILTTEFFNEMVTNSDAINNSPFSVQNWEGPSGGSIWLNDDSSNGDGADREGIPSFMPEAPYDMIYAGGNFGQFILVYPSHNLVVVRLGGDSPHSVHWAPVNKLALKCFAPEALRDDVVPEQEKVAPDTGKSLKLKEILEEDILYRSRAQELCSCLFVSGYKSVDQCDKMVPTQTKLFAFINSHNAVSKPRVDFKKKLVTLKKRFKKKYVISRFNSEKPNLGCQLQ